MSIRIEKYVGYGVDIEKELDSVDYELRDKILYNVSELSIEGLVEDGKNKGDIIILNDSMDGNFVKLFYILAKERCEYEEESSKVYSEVNRLLSSVEIPNEVRTSLLKVYNKLFDKIKSLEIKAEFVINYV